VIANPGDGSFHPFEEAEIHAALATLRFPLGRVRADVYVLPYPRRAGLESAAGPGLVLLAPGVRPLSREQQHAELVHELGHVVQRALLPDADQERWRAYRTLRGIEDATRFSAGAVHADRPHEIFAEDFRALFGGPLATYSGTIENSTIRPPAEVAGLEAFMLGLADASFPSALMAAPNPARGPVRFVRAGTTAAPLDIFDAQGRRVATLAPVLASGGVQWSWDGRARGGIPGPAVVYARVRDGSTPVVRVAVLR
jgi:hypothetical protein